MTNEETELREAADRLQAVKNRLAAAEDLKLSEARIALQERQLNLEREQQKQREYNEAVEAKFAAKAKAKADAEMAEQNAERAKQAALESEFNRIQEQNRLRLEHEAKVRKIQEEIFLMEAEAKRAEAEAFAERTKAEVPEFEPDTDADKSAENSGMDQQADGLEAAGQLNPILRHLFGRSADVATAKATPDFIPNYTQAPEPLTNAEIQVTLEKMYGKEVVVAAIAYLVTQKGTNNIQVYLSQNFKPISN
jgi:predicted phage tail protein